ncbi:hypothetical protein [Robertkochia sediminum]|uniref:hypothetical protein n=1 Tax=Robertkochia sediminum TaxID=2785326 RepID=UPI0019320861|nr:hypothetical protein [Robertkochia sediminum]MBL7473783.1 hypothetical protein [Robertkochia sediminum]
MEIADSFEEILKHSHFRNWSPDWDVLIKIYEAFPESYSVLSPFAYSYMEELIRSTTSEYGIELKDENGINKNRKVGIRLIELAIQENEPNNIEYVAILEEIKKYYHRSKATDEGNNRHSVAHGYMHPRFWNKDSFEKLIQDIARLSKFSGF